MHDPRNLETVTMGSIHVASDLTQCRAIWEQVMPSESITDLWEVRDCFQRHFRNRPHFIVSSDQNGVRGLLPLSWIEEQGCYGFFPGEIWQGKTWLEQNRIICNGNGGREDLLSACPSAYHLRYLRDADDIHGGQGVVDETGYLFSPPRYNYDMSNYFGEFSHKTAKNILRDISKIERLGVTYQHDEIADFEIMVSLNLGRFGPQSYFYDSRFRESFKDLALFLARKGVVAIHHGSRRRRTGSYGYGVRLPWCLYPAGRRNEPTLSGGGETDQCSPHAVGLQRETGSGGLPLR